MCWVLSGHCNQKFALFCNSSVFSRVSFPACILSFRQLKKPLYLSHALVFFNRNKLVVHAVNQQDGHCELSVVDLVPLRPVLPAHHGAQHKGRHVEGIVLFQQLFLLGTLPCKASPVGGRAEEIYLNYALLTKNKNKNSILMTSNCG